MQKTIVCQSMEDLAQAAQAFLQFAQDRHVYTFEGEMGAGKTTFIKAICHAMGVTDTVSSPTYSLVNEYQTAQHETLYHFDFYRIKNEQEAYDMGYEEYLYSDHKCFIEWPQMISNLLPTDVVKVAIVQEGNHRHIILEK